MHTPSIKHHSLKQRNTLMILQMQNKNRTLDILHMPSRAPSPTCERARLPIPRCSTSQFLLGGLNVIVKQVPVPHPAATDSSPQSGNPVTSTMSLMSVQSLVAQEACAVAGELFRLGYCQPGTVVGTQDCVSRRAAPNAWRNQYLTLT